MLPTASPASGDVAQRTKPRHQQPLEHRPRPRTTARRKNMADPVSEENESDDPSPTGHCGAPSWLRNPIIFWFTRSACSTLTRWELPTTSILMSGNAAGSTGCADGIAHETVVVSKDQQDRYVQCLHLLSVQRLRPPNTRAESLRPGVPQRTSRHTGRTPHPRCQASTAAFSLHVHRLGTCSPSSSVRLLAGRAG